MYTDASLPTSHGYLSHSVLSWKGGNPKIRAFGKWGNGRLSDIKAEALDAPVLAMPCSLGYLTFETDTCHEQICYVLMQDRPNGSKNPPWYWIRALRGEEWSCNTTHREWLAVVWPIQLLIRYFEGQRLTVFTDHVALRLVFSLADSTGGLAGGGLRLFELDIDVIHRMGIKIQLSNEICRLETEGTDKTRLGNNISDFVEWLVYCTRPFNDEQGGRSTEK